MRLTLHTPGRSVDVEIADVVDASLTVGELISLVIAPVPSPNTRVLLDGHAVDVDASISALALRHGSVIDAARTSECSAGGRPAVVVVDISGGLAAGTSFSLPAGAHALGRCPEASVRLDEPTVSRHHATLDVRADGSTAINTCGGRNGVRMAGSFVRAEGATVSIGQPVTVAATQLEVQPLEHTGNDEVDVDLSRVEQRHAAGPAGTILFNRPPRMANVTGHDPIRVPTIASTVLGRSPFSWVMFLAPLGAGLVMALLISPVFALFALLSPVMMAASWLEQTRRARRSSTSARRSFASALTAFEGRVARQAADELARRRREAPDLARVIRSARVGDARLWERRPAHDDFLRVRLGTAPLPWQPVLDDRVRHDLPDEVSAILEGHRRLADAPLVAELSSGSIIGIAGARRAARAVARSLVAQAVTQAGPADLSVRLLAAGPDVDEWAHLSWLPHPHDLRTGTTTDDLDDLDDRAGVVLTIVDDPRAELGHAIVRGALPPTMATASAIVLADDTADLPAGCSTVVALADDLGRARVTVPALGLSFDEVLLMGASITVATDHARALRRFADPEASRGQAELPASAELHEVLGHGVDDLDAIAAAWDAAAHDRLPVALGAGAGGPLIADLVRDGPHALVAGTTGSGKSELLRSLIASLVATASPDDLNLVLVDYKGGSAFDACAELPHTVGVVTDLDERLGERALISLDAEVRRREQQLRDAGVNGLDAYRRVVPATGEPLPRLVVIIDEFATLAVELPNFLDALVSIAQRGRSLGIHLILATQRPHGVINENIRTNTNLRIALRMLDDAESNDVIGCPVAASIARARPGRAFVRLGRDEVLPFQSAHSAAVIAGARTGRAPAPASSKAEPLVIPLDAWGRPAGDSGSAREDDEPPPASESRDDRTALEGLVATVRALHDARDGRAPRRPWLAPLPERLALADLARFPADVRPGGVTIGVVDQPRAQAQSTWSWQPTDGNLLIFGRPGSGATTTLLTLAVQLATRRDPGRVHLYAFDFGPGALAPLATLAHTGAVVRVDERARQHRLLDTLHDELARRRAIGAADQPVGADASDPSIVVLVDDAGAMRGAYGDLAGLDFLERFHRLALDGPAFGIHLAITGDRPQAMPPALIAAASQRLVLHLADRYDYGLCGVAPRPPSPDVPGRGVTGDELEVQLAFVSPDALAGTLADLNDRWRSVLPSAMPPKAIGELPVRVSIGDVGRARVGADGWRLPLGVGDRDLTPRFLDLLDGDHVLITGPPRSGRTTLLTSLAVAALDGAAGVLVLADRPDAALCLALSSRSRAVTAVCAAELPTAVASREGAPTLVLIDDADRFDDVDGVLAALCERAPAGTHLVAAGRADRLRPAYGHWTRALRTSRLGVALRPDLDADGDLWSVRFGSLRGAAWPTGRAVLVRDGDVELVHTAAP